MKLRKPLTLLTGVSLGLAVLSPWVTPPKANALPVLPTFGETVAKDVPYVPTPQEVVDAMLKIANVNSQDVLLDLGSGDGRIVITAAKDYKVQKAVGVEIDPAFTQVLGVKPRILQPVKSSTAAAAYQDGLNSPRGNN